MGRQKSSATPETPAPANGQGQGQTLTGAIVATLKTLGVNAETAAVRTHIQQHFPGIDVRAASFDSTLSLKRKNLREGTVGRTKVVKRRKPAQVIHRTAPIAAITTLEAIPSEPTLAELIRIKEAADKQGGVEVLLQAVESIRGVAEEAGGLDRLSKGLDALRKLTAK